MEWREEKCLELISAYEKQYNTLRRYDAWEEVAGEMGVYGETCKRKITCLSTTELNGSHRFSRRDEVRLAWKVITCVRDWAPFEAWLGPLLTNVDTVLD
jgi:hypothetical protein